MDRIWANRLEAGTKLWSQVPDNRKAGVKAILADDLINERNGMNLDKYKAITGEEYM